MGMWCSVAAGMAPTAVGQGVGRREYCSQGVGAHRGGIRHLGPGMAPATGVGTVRQYGSGTGNLGPVE